MPNSQPQELIAAQIIDDPFSVEFMEQAEQNPTVIHVSASSLPRRTRSRVARVKMVIQKELKARLIKLKSTNVPDVVKEIVDDILNMKYVPEDIKYCNYLGLSQADYGKISYVDKDREEKLKDQETTLHLIKPGTKVKITYQRNFVTMGNSPIYTKELVLTARHLNERVFPIREFVERTERFTVVYTNGFSEVSSFTYLDAHLELDSDIFRIHNSRLEGSGRIQVGQNGFDNSNNMYWCTILGVEFEKTQVTVKELWNFKKRYHTSVGKIIRRLFEGKYSDRDITAFAESYASLITVSNPMYDFEIIEGEAIRDAYLEDNYANHHGTLGNSCMRYSRCQSYFDMYVNNPDKIRMGVLRRGRKVAARTLLWFINDKWHYDRIYFNNNETHNLLKNTLESNGYQTIYCINEEFKIKIDLSNIEKFPYVDTMYTYNPDTMILSNGQRSETRYYAFRSTGGCYDLCNAYDNYECAVCGDEVHNDDVVILDAGRLEGSAVCNCCAVYSETYDHYFTIEDEYVYTTSGDPILSRYAVTLFNDEATYDDNEYLKEYANDYGFFLTNQHTYFTDGNLYYHPEDPDRPENAYDETEDARMQAEEQAREIEELRNRLANGRNLMINGQTNFITTEGITPTFTSNITTSTSSTYIHTNVEYPIENQVIQLNRITEEELEIEQENEPLI